MSENPRQQPRKKRRVGLLIFAFVIVALMVAEGIILTISFVSPSGSKSISEGIRKAQDAWQGTEESPGIKARAGGALNDFFDEEVRPLWEAPEPAGSESTSFTTCGMCHPDYQSDRRFASVYMDHPLHEQIGADCATCHTATQHPNPARPTEDVCAECHEEVNQKKRCDYCHSPGSLPHFYLLGYPRRSAVDCATCHPKDSFEGATPERLVHPGPFDGSQKGICLSCHEQKTSQTYGLPACLECHSMEHPPGWGQGEHGLESGVPWVGTSGCVECHRSDRWCADQCHPNEDPTPKYPLPRKVPE